MLYEKIKYGQKRTVTRDYVKGDVLMNGGAEIHIKEDIIVDVVEMYFKLPYGTGQWRDYTVKWGTARPKNVPPKTSFWSRLFRKPVVTLPVAKVIK